MYGACRVIMLLNIIHWSGVLIQTHFLQLLTLFNYRHTFLKSVNEDAIWFGVSVAFLFLLWALFMLW